jgi:hypothetical protein
VRDSIFKFGDSAGKIWQTLYEHGHLEEEKLLELTRLTDSELHAGIGWLARENKIAKKDQYELNNTNLKSKIGTNAGKVWKVMDIWGELDFPTMTKLTRMDGQDVYSALGWLAREDKICSDLQLEKFNLR